MGRLYLSSVMGLSYLQAYFNSSHTFSLIYGEKAIVPFEVMVPSAHLILASEVSDPRDNIHNKEKPEVKRRNTKSKWLNYQRQISKAYNKEVRSYTLKIGDLVLQARRHMQKRLNISKFVSRWKEQYSIHIAYESGCFLIYCPNSDRY